MTAIRGESQRHPSTMARVRATIAGVLSLGLGLAIGLASASPTSAAVTTGEISGTAPLAMITQGAGFSQQMVHATIAPGQGGFFHPGQLQNPSGSYSRVFAQSSGGSALGFPDGAQTFGGSGTRIDPYFLQTQSTSDSVLAGIQMTDRLSYVDGDAYYRNDVTLRNTTAAPVSLNFYRYGDCYLAGDDQGVSQIPTTSAQCVNDFTAMSLIPASPGYRLQSGEFYAVAKRVDTNAGLNDQCIDAVGATLSAAACQSLVQDNGFALEYPNQVLAPGASVSLAYLTNYAAEPPVFADLQPDTMPTPVSVTVGDTFTYRVTLANNGPSTASDPTASLVMDPLLEVVSTAGSGDLDPETGIWDLGAFISPGSNALLLVRVVAKATGNAHIGVTSAQSAAIDNTPCSVGSTLNCGTQRIVRILGPDAASSSFTVTTGDRVADGGATHTVTATVRTSEDQPVSGQAGALSLGASPSAGVVFGPLTETSPGTYEATVSSTSSGAKTIVPTIDGIGVPVAPGGNGIARFVPGPVFEGTSTVEIDDEDGRVADGQQAHQVTATLRDENGNPVPGMAAALTADLPDGDVAITAFEETASPGVYTALVTATVAGSHEVGVLVAGTPLGTVTAYFVAGPVDLAIGSTLLELVTTGTKQVGDPATVTIGDTDNVHVVRATLTDAFGNPVAGEDVTFDLPAGLVPVQGVAATVVSGPDGTAELAVTTDGSGAYPVTATVEGGQILHGSPAVAVFAPDVPAFGAGQTTIDASDGAVVADGEATHVVTVTARDRFGNPVPGAAAAIVLPGEVLPADGATTTGTTDGDGRFVLLVTSTIAGTHEVSATLDGTPVTQGAPATVTFAAGAPSATESSFEVTPPGPLAVGDQYAGSVVVRDVLGNPVPDYPVTFVAAGDARIVEDGPYLTDASGRVTVHATSTVVGTYAFLAAIGGDGIDAPVDIAFVAGPPDVGHGSTELRRTTPTLTVVADGVAAHEVTASVTDRFGNPVPGIDVDFAVPADVAVPGAGSPTVPTDASGRAVLSVVSTVAGVHEVTATVAGDAIVNGSPVAIRFVAGPVSPERSSLIVDPAGPLTVGDAPENTYTATALLRDAFDNPIGGHQVTFDADPELIQSSEGGVTDAAGEFAITLRSHVVGAFDTTATASGTAIGTETREFVAGPPDLAADGRSLLTATAGTRIADGVDPHVLTATLQDRFGNPIAGQDVAFALPADVQSVIGATVVATGPDGTATLAVVSSTAATYEASAYVGVVSEGTLIRNGDPAPLVFVAGAPDAVASDLRVDPAPSLVVGIGTGNAFTGDVTVRDAQGNPVADAVVDLAVLDEDGAPVTGQPFLSAGQVVSGADGVATVTVSSTLAGSFSLVASLGADPVTGSPGPLGWVPGPATAVDSVLDLSTGVVPADGVTAHTATITAKDEYGNTVTDPVTFTMHVAAPATGAGDVVTDASGTVVVPITSEVAGTYAVSATLGGETVYPGGGTVVFGPADASPARSTIEADPTTLVADGVATSTVTVSLFDALGNALDEGGDAVTMATTVGTLGSVTDNGDGTYTATLTAPTVVGRAEVSFAVDGVDATATATVTFTPDVASPGRSTIGADPTVLVADGVATSTVTVSLLDAYGNPVEAGGDTVTMATTVGTLGSVTDNGDGTYTAILTAPTAPDTATVTFAVDGVDAVATATVTFTPGVADAARSTIGADPTVLVADGVAASTITVTARDAQGNPVGAGGDTVTMATTVGTLGPVTDNGDGTYTATLTAPTVVGRAEVSFAVDGATATATADVAFTPGPASASRSTITADPTVVVADGTSGSTITVALYDGFGNALDASGGTVTMATTAGTLGSVTDNGDGTYTAILTAPTAAATGTVTFTVDGASATASAAVVFVPGAYALGSSTIAASRTTLEADGSSMTEITVTLRDSFGNPVGAGGSDVGITSTAGTLGPVVDNGDGTYTAVLTAPTQVGESTVGFSVAGTTSPRTLLVTFVAGVASPARSTIAADPTTLVADGTSTSTVTVRLLDAFDNPLDAPGGAVAMTTTAGTLGPVVDNGDGTYTAVLTSPTTPGRAIVGFLVDGNQGANEAFVDLVAGPPSAQTSTIAASPPTLVADSGTVSAVTVTLFDAHGHRVGTGGDDVAIATTLGTLSDVTDNGDGTYGAVLTAGPLGLAALSFTVNGEDATATATVEFVVGAPDLGASTITASPTVIESDGVSTSTITVRLVDAWGHPIAGADVAVSTTAGTLGPVTDHGDGTYTAELTSATRPGTAIDGFAVGGVASPHTVDVTFEDTRTPEPPTFTGPTPGGVVPERPTFTGTGEPEATVTVRDKDGNTVCTAVVAADGIWSCTPSTPLPLGPGEFTAVQTDASGHVSGPSAPLTVMVTGTPSLTLADSTVPQGGSTTVTGHGFVPGERVTGVVNSDPIDLGAQVADADGTVTFRIVVPRDFDTGEHTVTLTGESSGPVSGQLTVTPVTGAVPTPTPTPVTGPTPVLPWTGVDALPLAIGAGLLLLIGAGLLVVRRRRRS